MYNRVKLWLILRICNIGAKSLTTVLFLPLFATDIVHLENFVFFYHVSNRVKRLSTKLVVHQDALQIGCSYFSRSRNKKKVSRSPSFRREIHFFTCFDQHQLYLGSSDQWRESFFPSRSLGSSNFSPP